MRIIKKESAKQTKSVQAPMTKDYNGLTQILFTEDDVDKFRSIQSHLSDYGWGTSLISALKKRKELNEITISHQNGKDIREGTAYIEPSLLKDLMDEADEHGISLQDYIRGIIYSLGCKWIEESHKKRLAEEKFIHNNRVISVGILISKDIRENLYKKYGNLSDNALIKKVREDVLSYLSKT